MPNLFSHVMGMDCLPGRSFDIRSLVLGMRDTSEEIMAEIEELEWLLMAGNGPLLEMLFRLPKIES